MRFEQDFLDFCKSESSGKQRVMLFQGKWGTGKTYFWNHFVEAHRDDIKERFYSYVSLFGSGSIPHIRGLVMFGARSLRESETWEDRRKRIVQLVLSKARYLNVLNIPYIRNVDAALANLEELFIKDYLICFDDLERRNQSLDMEQFLGFVSVLKEQNNCRVVLICNENELSETDKKALDKYREKIVDRQITFAPTFDDNFRIIFPPENDEIRGSFASLELNNIRVFQQTAWCLAYFEPFFAKLDPALRTALRQQCTKLACIHYAYARVVSLGNFREGSWLSSFLKDKNEPASEADRLREILEFVPTDFDDFVVEYLENGYCEPTKLESVLARLNSAQAKAIAEAELRRVWRLVYDSFRADSGEIVEKAVKCVTDHYANLHFESVEALFGLLREIEGSFQPGPLWEQVCSHAASISDIASLAHIEEVCDSLAVKNAVAQRRTELRDSRSISDLVRALSHPEGWNPSDFVRLDQYSDTDFINWLRDSDGELSLSDVATVIVRGMTGSVSEGGAPLAAKLLGAVKTFSSRSALDALRVDKYVLRRINSGLAERGHPPLAP